jgi:uncharacterized protein (TIGR03067 family)
MNLSRLLCATALLAAFGFAPAPFPKKDKLIRDDLETLQGVWRMTQQESAGNASPHNYKARVRGNRWTFIMLNQNKESDGPAYFFAIDQRAAPRALEWKSTQEATSGWVGSYRIEGRKLTIVYDMGTLKDMTRRPTDFVGRAPHKMVFEYVGRE